MLFLKKKLLRPSVKIRNSKNRRGIFNHNNLYGMSHRKVHNINQQHFLEGDLIN